MADLGMTAEHAPSPAPSHGALHDPPSGLTAGEVNLTRTRILVLLVGYMVLGAAAHGVFDRFESALVAAPILPAVAAVLTVTHRLAIRVVGAIVAIGLTVTASILAANGGTGAVGEALTSGVQGLLSTEWPSPARPELIGAVVALIATAMAVSAELTTRRRFHLLPLLPLIVAYVGVVALSAPLGTQWWWLALLAGVSTLFALLRNDGTLHDRLVLLRGERGLVGLLIIAATIAALLTIPISMTARADPRRNDPAEQTLPLVDPIQATIALRNLEPPIDLHVVTPRDRDPLPVRWRTAALQDFDGRRWSPGLTLRPIGTTLGPVSGPVTRADVSFLDESLSLVPLPGAPVRVDAAVETDADRTVVRLVEPPTPGTEVAVVANTAPTTGDAIEVGIQPRLIDESATSFGELAGGLVGDGTPIDQLTQLETTMRNDFVLDNDVQGGGLQQALIDRFVRDTQRGTTEQFVTAFVLLARSLGIEARVATGFVAGGTSDDPTATGESGVSITLRSADADLWPEVQLTDGRWIAFDPVPDNEATDGEPPPPVPDAQTPAAPQPPIAPPPDPADETTERDDTADDGATTGLSSLTTWTIRGGIAVAVLLLPVLVGSLVVLGTKRRRRKRRLTASAPAERIRGAWASATDALVDAGLEIDTCATDAEIAHAGIPLVADAQRELQLLAKLSSAATYGTPEHPDLLAEDATKCLGAVETSMEAMRSPWQRLRWRLSLRSLRPDTRSPVAS
jgi:transglutaminase-like putative cysteine protease